MVLLRVRDEEGVLGLGEAVPLSLRGGATLAQVVRELEEFAASARSAGYPARHVRRHHRGVGRLQRRRPPRCALLDRLVRSRRAGSREADGAEPVPCNATLVAGEPAAVAEDALRWAAEGYRDLQAEARRRRRRRARSQRFGKRSAPRRRSASTPTRLGTSRRRSEVLAELEPLGIAARRAAGGERWRRRRSSPGTPPIPLAGDESIETAEDASARRCRSGLPRRPGSSSRRSAASTPAMEIAKKLPAYVSSALDGPVGIAVGARLAAACRTCPGPQRRTRPRARDPAALRLDDRLGRVRAEGRHVAAAARPRASGSRSTRMRWTAHRL